MNINNLIAVGLSAPQAKAYALLIEHGTVQPSAASEQLGMSRTNTYKVFDKLVEMRLAEKFEQGKKFVYKARNPNSLVDLASEFRAAATAREVATQNLLKELLPAYYGNVQSPTVTVYTGAQKVASAYRKQILLKEDIHFIRTDHDIPTMGFEAMHIIRTAPAANGNQRYGILTKPNNGPINHDKHKKSKLETHWLQQQDYTAPVEWSITESSLLIVLYGASEPHAIFIDDRQVAAAFLQIWSLVSRLCQTLS